MSERSPEVQKSVRDFLSQLAGELDSMPYGRIAEQERAAHIRKRIQERLQKREELEELHDQISREVEGLPGMFTGTALERQSVLLVVRERLSSLQTSLPSLPPSLNPTNWSPEIQRNMAIGAGVVAGAGILATMFQRAGEATQGARRWIKNFFKGALAIGAGLFGFHLFQRVARAEQAVENVQLAAAEQAWRGLQATLRNSPVLPRSSLPTLAGTFQAAVRQLPQELEQTFLTRQNFIPGPVIVEGRGKRYQVTYNAQERSFGIQELPASSASLVQQNLSGLSLWLGERISNPTTLAGVVASDPRLNQPLQVYIRIGGIPFNQAKTQEPLSLYMHDPRLQQDLHALAKLCVRFRDNPPYSRGLLTGIENVSLSAFLERIGPYTLALGRIGRAFQLRSRNNVDQLQAGLREVFEPGTLEVDGELPSYHEHIRKLHSGLQHHEREFIGYCRQHSSVSLTALTVTPMPTADGSDSALLHRGALALRDLILSDNIRRYLLICLRADVVPTVEADLRRALSESTLPDALQLFMFIQETYRRMPDGSAQAVNRLGDMTLTGRTLLELKLTEIIGRRGRNDAQMLLNDMITSGGNPLLTDRTVQ